MEQSIFYDSRLIRVQSESSPSLLRSLFRSLSNLSHDPDPSDIADYKLHRARTPEKPNSDDHPWSALDVVSSSSTLKTHWLTAKPNAMQVHRIAKLSKQLKFKQMVYP